MENPFKKLFSKSKKSEPKTPKDATGFTDPETHGFPMASANSEPVASRGSE